MRRLSIVLAVGLFLLFATAVFADAPHFINAGVSLGPGASITVSFKEAGLGTNQLITYVASADSTATYACINGGHNHPQAGNKETVSGPVSATGTFSSGKNGNVVASLVVGPLGPGDFTCPNGQTLTLAQVTYDHIAITDTTNGVSLPIYGSFCEQLVNLDEFKCP